MLNFSYRRKESPIHQLNPFAKLAWTASLLILTLIFNHPFYLVMLFLSTLPVVLIGRIRREWLSFMKLGVYICIAIVIINGLVSQQGSHILLEAPFRLPLVGNPVVTLEALAYGGAMALRILTIFSAFSIVTLCTHPDDLLQAMIKLKLPYRSVLVTSLSTRFVPTLMYDAANISDVQRSRGLELDKGSFFQRLRRRSTIVIALLSNSLDRSVQLAEAMESRAFGTAKKRTNYHSIEFSSIDLVTIIPGIISCITGIVFVVQGYGSYTYYPSLQQLTLYSGEMMMLPVLFVILISLIPAAIAKRSLEFD